MGSNNRPLTFTDEKTTKQEKGIFLMEQPYKEFDARSFPSYVITDSLGANCMAYDKTTVLQIQDGDHEITNPMVRISAPRLWRLRSSRTAFTLLRRTLADWMLTTTSGAAAPSLAPARSMSGPTIIMRAAASPMKMLRRSRCSQQPSTSRWRAASRSSTTPRSVEPTGDRTSISRCIRMC